MCEVVSQSILCHLSPCTLLGDACHVLVLYTCRSESLLFVLVFTSFNKHLYSTIVVLSVKITLVIISASTTESTWLAVVCQVTHLLTLRVTFVDFGRGFCFALLFLLPLTVFVPFTQSAILDLVYRYLLPGVIIYSVILFQK